MDDRERASRAAQAARLVPEWRARGVRAVATTWVDNSGVTRVKAVPLRRLEHAAAWGIGASPVFDTFLLDDSMVVGRYAGGPVGDLRLHPDLDRAVALLAQPGWAWAPADRFDQDGRPHPQDHRAVCRREVARLAELGCSVRAAFEVEWVVSAGEGDEFVPASRGPAYGFARLTELSDYLASVLTTLAAQGVTVEQIHPEYAAGQYELSVATSEPLTAADTFVLVRETIRAVSARAGLRASFSPKVVPDGVGNGAHVHLSVWREDRDVMTGGAGRYGLDPVGEAFIAGILDRLPALLAIGAPSVASYLRLIPEHWAGAYAAWGRENRETAIRFVTGSVGERSRAANVEIKAFDPAANPYLVMAGLLASGRVGIQDESRLPEPVEVDPASLDEATRRARGIERLPTSLAESTAAFEADPVLRDAFGEELVDTIAAVRRGEIALFADATPERVTAVTRWRH